MTLGLMRRPIEIKFVTSVGTMIVACATIAVSSFHTGAWALQSQGLSARQPEANGVYYIESWKKGSRRIQNQSFYKRLDAYDPSFKAILRDSSKSDQFQLLVEPQYYVRNAQGKLKFKTQPTVPLSKVNFWQVKLLENSEQVSLLIADKDQGDFMDWKNTLANLDPVEDDKGYLVGIFGVPISSKRVIKVESFYCIINVLNYQLNQMQRAFDWLDLEIVLTNKQPDIIDRALR